VFKLGAVITRELAIQLPKPGSITMYQINLFIVFGYQQISFDPGYAAGRLYLKIRESVNFLLLVFLIYI
jgi:hypothetical protein